jgi:hypothetical protein
MENMTKERKKERKKERILFTVSEPVQQKIHFCYVHCCFMHKLIIVRHQFQ